MVPCDATTRPRSRPVAPEVPEVPAVPGQESQEEVAGQEALVVQEAKEDSDPGDPEAPVQGSSEEEGLVALASLSGCCL